MYFGGSIGLRARDVGVVQGAVHGAQVLCGHTTHTQIGVLSRSGVGGGGVVALRSGLNGHERVLVSGDGAADDALQLAEGVGTRATVGLRRYGVEHRAQVVRGDPCEPQGGEMNFGE